MYVVYKCCEPAVHHSQSAELSDLYLITIALHTVVAGDDVMYF